MELKKWVFSIILIFAQFSFSAGMEEQRKYKFQNLISDDDFKKLIQQKKSDFTWAYHSEYQTWDIYLDTEQNDLQKKGLSFRLRRVEKTKGHYDYAIQLKSEMQVVGAERMEVEYKDFSFQFIEKNLISHLLDSYFDESFLVQSEFKNREAISELLVKWLERKKSSSLAPFQKLRSLGLAKKIYKPQVIVTSKRQRFHIVINRPEVKGELALLKESEKEASFLDVLLKQHPEWIWLFEASLDRTQLSTVATYPQSKMIQELEIENKFRPRKMGTKLLVLFENYLIKDLNLTTATKSKFVQAIDSQIDESTQ